MIDSQHIIYWLNLLPGAVFTAYIIKRHIEVFRTRPNIAKKTSSTKSFLPRGLPKKTSLPSLAALVIAFVLSSPPNFFGLPLGFHFLLSPQFTTVCMSSLYQASHPFIPHASSVRTVCFSHTSIILAEVILCASSQKIKARFLTAIGARKEGDFISS